MTKAEQLQELIRQAVADAVEKAEKPLGVLLSGGVDSSTVAAFAGNLTTFTGYYPDLGFSEVEYARQAAKGEHHLIYIRPADFVDNFDRMVCNIDPFHVGPGVFGQWMVAAKVASLGIKTVFSGEGGDELFGGYARLMYVAGHPLPDGYASYTPPPDYPDTLEEALKYDWERLPVLMAADEEICNAWGITVVPPLMDKRVVEFALNLPAHERVGKKLLREAMRGIVPDAILDRKDKKGFPTPFVYWAQEEPVRSFVLDRIGYIPDPAQPFAREWWYDLCRASKERVTA